MSHYKNVLVAVDGSAEETETIIGRAVQLAASSKAKLSVVLVFEPLLGNYSFELNMADFEKLQQQHQELLAGRIRTLLTKKFPSIDVKNLHLLRGKPATEIKRLAEDEKVDLLVIGSHGHNPIRAVLGSTANAVLHGIHCDVMTVRV